MSVYKDLALELRAKVAAAELVAQKAEAEGRELTAQEIIEGKELLAEAMRIKGRAAQVKAEAAARQELAALGESMAGPGFKDADRGPGRTVGGGSKGHHLDPRVKAAGGSTWADTVIRRSTDEFGHFKGLLAAGTIPVTVPLDPEPIRTDVPVLSLRQLIPVAPNTGPRFSYLRQTTRTNNAAVVAAGAKKPTSLYTLTRFDDRVRTIAHLSEPINKFDLEDAPSLRQFLDQEMRLGLELGLEGEILNGDGTGEHMTGVANVAGSQSQAFTTDILTTARKAVTKLEKVGHLTGAGWLMHPDDWEAFELLQDNEARFYYGGPGNAVNPTSRRLWGAPVVTSLSATVGTTHLVDWQAATRLHVLEDGTLDWSENLYDPNALGAGVGASDFERNMIRFRFEGRFGLEILRPSAIVEVDLTA